MNLIQPFWLEDYSILIKHYNIFMPIHGMTNNEKLNAVVRFSFYLSLILFFTKRTFNVFMLPVFTALVTIFVNKMNYAKQDSEELDDIINELKEDANCQMPDETNPYMNTLVSDLDHKKEKKEACPMTKEIREKQHDLFYKNLKRDVGDLYEKSNSERQFYTLPNTTKYGMSMGDTVGFANFLFNTDSSCKEDNSECTSANSIFTDDLRRNRNTIIHETVDK